MKIEIPRKIEVNIVGVSFFICLVYIILRSFLTSYVTPLCKYVFILIILGALCWSLLHANVTLKKMGFCELSLCIMFYLYVIVNAYVYGGKELFSYALERYIFYTMPLFLIPFFGDKINWYRVLNFMAVFGVVDSFVSIIEFATKQRIFLMGSDSADIIYVTDESISVSRTYGLEGNYFLLAEILCVCGFSAFILFRYFKKKWAFVSFIIISIGILTTGTRGYYVSYAIAFVFLFFYTQKKGYKRNKMILNVSILLLGIIAIYLVLFTKISAGIASVNTVLTRIRMIIDWSGDTANIERVVHWLNAIARWKSSFWFGNGACCTDTRYSGYVAVTESGVLKRLVELGTVGTILQYLTMIVPLRQGIKRIRRGEFKGSYYVPFFGAIIISFLVEDIVLQRYTAIEYTNIIWTAIAMLAYSNPSKNNIN